MDRDSQLMNLTRVSLIAILVASFSIIGNIAQGRRAHYMNINYQNQIKQNQDLSNTIIDLTKTDSQLIAKVEGLESTIFANQYYSFKKDLEGKSKKDLKAKQFLFYLNLLENEVRRESLTPEDYNVNYRKRVFEKSEKDPYFQWGMSYMPPSLLRQFPVKYSSK